MAETTPYTLPSLIGGVSEQSPHERPTSMAEDQQNCWNDSLNGVMARPGGVVLGAVTGYEMQNPFVGTIERTSKEVYKVLIEQGVVRVINIATGADCTVTPVDDMGTYLNHTGSAKMAFDMVTVEDTTFIVNRQVITAMKADLTPDRPNKGIFYFKAGEYSTTYTAVLDFNSEKAAAKYTTPDNSASTNARYITTNRLSKELMDALNIVRSDVSPAWNHLTINHAGSNVYITADNTWNFDMDTEDGLGDTQLVAIKDWVKKFSDLPVRAPSGFIVGIRGSKGDQQDDYWVKFSGPETTGYWREVAKPGIPYKVDAATMPIILANVGVNSFELRLGTWGNRISGDGEKTSKDPVFIGTRIVGLDFTSGRLSCLTSGGMQLSRARNAYVFFPDTAQARLATDPIGFDVATGKTTILSRLVSISEHLYMWGRGKQLRLDTGDGPLTEETAEAKPSTEYVYDGIVPPRTIGLSSLVFGTKAGNGVKMVEVEYQQGTPVGEIYINEHCPKLIKGELKGLETGGESGLMVTWTELDDHLYVYQWKNQGNQRVQTAWNKWNFLDVDKIVATQVLDGDLYAIFKNGNSLLVEKFTIDPLDLATRDIRLDHKVTEEGSVYDTDGLIISLPYSVDPANRALYKALGNEDQVLVLPYGEVFEIEPPELYVAPEDGEYLDGNYLGAELVYEWIDNRTIKVLTDDPDAKVFFGALIDARRTFSQLYLTNPKTGVILHDTLMVAKIKVAHADTTYYRLEVRNRRGELLKTQAFDARTNWPTQPVNELPKDTGSANFDVGAEDQTVRMTLINDTPYPSRWVSVVYNQSPTIR